MKKLLVLASLLLAASTTTPSLAQHSANDSADPLVTFGANAFARTGMSRAALVAQLGEPSEKLGVNVWAYWNFRAMGRPVGERGDALIVVFTQDKVSLLRVTERTAVEAALLKARTHAGKPAVIAKQ